MMGVFNVRALLSAVGVCVVMGSTAASAAVVDLYQITVKGTMQEIVDAGQARMLFSDAIWQPIFGKSVEMTFSMPLNNPPYFAVANAAGFKGVATVRIGDTLLKSETPAREADLILRDGPTSDILSSYTLLENNAFGFHRFDTAISAEFVFFDTDASAFDLSADPPRSVDQSTLEQRHIEVNSFDADAAGGLNGIFSGYASVDSVSVDIIVPEPVPLPASVLLLGVGLAGLGALRRRQKAA